MRATVGLFFAALALPDIAHGGAWPREEEEIFIAAGGNFYLSDGAELPVYYDPTLYAEYGLTERITLGLDLYTADRARIVSGFAFARVPVGPADGANRTAVSLAFGTRIDAREQAAWMMRGGVHWGRGLSSGWLSADVTGTIEAGQTRWRPKAELTWGHNWSDDWTTTLQLQTGEGFTGDRYAKVAPSVVWHATEDISISVGAVQALTGDGGFGLNLQSWLRF